MCIRDSYNAKAAINRFTKTTQLSFLGQLNNINQQGFSFNDRMNFSGGMRGMSGGCLLYTSDAADERSSVDLGGRRIIKKKKTMKDEVARNSKKP